MSEQAITLFVDGVRRLVRAFVPPALIEPGRTADLALDLAQQTLTVSRRAAYDVLA